jgi:hypothetical protein
MMTTHYTFRVTCIATLQFTFPDSEVQPVIDGDPAAVEPKADALHRLRQEFADYLGNDYAIDAVEVHAESDDLIGSVEVAGS